MQLHRIDSHIKLQNMAESISGRYLAPDPYILRCAVLEVLQNTLQHSDGRFIIKFAQDCFKIINLIKQTEYSGYGLGLKLYSGVKTESRGKLFISVVTPHEVCLNRLVLEGRGEIEDIREFE